MSRENAHVKVDTGGDRDALAEPGGTDHDKRPQLWVNWALVLLTVVGAGIVMVVASLFTARRRWGFAIPVIALALLIAAVAILVTTVAQ